MRQVIVIALAGLGLAGCASFSIPGMDAFRPSPSTINVQLDSLPPGADAVTSVGPGCKTPCSVAVATNQDFTVTFTLNRFLPQTVPVQVIQQPPEFGVPNTAIVDPNPVVAELQPAAPPKRGRQVAKRPPPRRSVPQVAPAPSPFPTPSR